MKKFTRIEPTTIQEFGLLYKQMAVVKRFQTEDGLKHEFTTVYAEGTRAAGVIALTPDNQIIAVFQFRAGPEKWIYDIPGGGVKPDESTKDGALRELKEETGYVPGKVEFLGESRGDGYRNLTNSYYFATDCVLGEGGDMLDDEESNQGAEVRLIPISKFIEEARCGNVSDAPAVLMAYEKLKELEKLSK